MKLPRQNFDPAAAIIALAGGGGIAALWLRMPWSLAVGLALALVLGWRDDDAGCV